MVIFGFRPRDTNVDATIRDDEVLHDEGLMDITLSFFTPVIPTTWAVLYFIYYLKLGHDHHVEATRGEEDEDITATISFTVWDNVNRRTRWIVDWFRVPEGEMRLSPFLQWVFLLLGILASIPFLIARAFQTGHDDTLLTLWTVELRMSGDLLIPVMVLFLTIHQFSDLTSGTIIKWKGIFILMVLCYIVDTVTFFYQPPGFTQKTANTEDKNGGTWFGRQVVVCVSVVLLLVLIIVQKKRCIKMEEDAKKKHVFENVAFMAFSTFPTLTYLISEYFACATRSISANFNSMEGKPQEQVVSAFILTNKCEGISYGLMPLVLLLVFTALGKIVYPESTDDLKMKNIMTLSLHPFRIFQLAITSLQALIAIIMFGVRSEWQVDPWVELLCNCYFIGTLFFFILEGFYTTFFKEKKKRRQSREAEDDDLEANTAADTASLRVKRKTLEARKKAGSKQSVWEGGTGNHVRVLKKDRTNRHLGNRMEDDLMMGAGGLGEGSLAPGML
ncbi:hypothetical protein TrST_g4127 [Triparma strigata]|uniref:Uncharacterized protein n=2 Tax=Triparma strigata TaxID=1606541 RepID=A0A9W6ZKG4_9STRA|nr:hypothetical protein TrST_g4127 [Triparma strigata]